MGYVGGFVFHNVTSLTLLFCFSALSFPSYAVLLGRGPRRKDGVTMLENLVAIRGSFGDHVEKREVLEGWG